MHFRILFALLLTIVYGPTNLAQSAKQVQNITMVRAQALEAELNNQPDAAIALYDKALNLACLEYGPASSYVGGLYVDLGNICMRSGKVQNAENYLRQAIKCSPNSRLAKLKLAEVLALKGRDEASTKVLEQLVSKKPNELSARRALAMGFQQHGNFAKANREFALIQDVASGRRQAKQIIHMPESQDTRLETAPAKTVNEAGSPIKAILPNVSKDSHKDSSPQKSQEPEKDKTTKPLSTKPTPVKPAPIKPITAKPTPVKPAVKPTVKPNKPALEKTKAPSISKPPVVEAKPVKVPEPKPKPVKPKKEPEAGALNLKPTKPAKASGHGGLVPPPPPMVMPGYPVYAPTQAPPAQPKPAAKPKPKPAPEKPSAPANQGSSEDADFLLDWAKKK